MIPSVGPVRSTQTLYIYIRVCYDPFSGTGSLLIAAAHYGAICVASDIDHKYTAYRRTLLQLSLSHTHTLSLSFSLSSDTDPNRES